jgi:septum formation topological specificity factor MinE
MENKQITLISSDGIRFDVEIEKIVASHEHPNLSVTIKDLIDDITGENMEIPLQIIDKDSLKSDVVKVIIEYCQKQYENPPEVVEGTTNEIIDVIKQHIKFHQDRIHNFNEIENELDNCNFTTKIIPQTYWQILQEKIKPEILQFLSLNYSEDILEDIWVHLRRFHENGYCCRDDDKLEKNAGNGKTKYEVAEWSRNILEKYKNDLNSTNFEESFLARLGIAADFLNITNLQEDVAHLFSEYIEKTLLGEIKSFDENEKYQKVREFFNVDDDMTTDEKLKILQTIAYIDTCPW